MIISTSWLADYVQVHASADDLAERLALSGLNHESTTHVGADTAIEIEVTSNRSDCLGHVGVAREVAALYHKPLAVPDPRPLEAGGQASASVSVSIESPEMCPFYSARVIRGVRIGPSPSWLVERLATVGVASVNNVVDVTNYVMLECGQPLHAFDLAKVAGKKIIVRRARAEEPFVAINHKTYTLDDRMCVIADAERPVALAGVMGGAESEISEHTVDVLIESAQFLPLPVRAAARSLALASASSYRFERGPDPAMVDWASRRAAALILELAGGVLEQGAVTAGKLLATPATIPLDPERVCEVLGCDVSAARQREILVALGFHPADDTATRWHAPTWRRDCTREIDLVEEIARIEGYQHVPEDMTIAAKPAEISVRERAVRAVGEVLMGQGFCEAMTRSVVDDSLAALAGGWTTEKPLTISPPLVRGADRLRQSLLPSLLEARAGNVAVGNVDADLFEIARGYLSQRATSDPSAGPVDEPLFVSFVMGGDSPSGSTFFHAKGLVAAILARFGLPTAAISYLPVNDLTLLAPGRTAEVVLTLPGHPPRRAGLVGEIAPDIVDRFSLPGPVAAAELRLDLVEEFIARDRTLVRHGDFPAVARDINLVLDESVPWAQLEAAILSAGGDLLERVTVGEIWRDADRLGAGKKSVVVSLALRSRTGTLTGDEAAAVVASIVSACGTQCGSNLRA
jgi:phenylalanyl-tRNA synthetase beta chain